MEVCFDGVEFVFYFFHSFVFGLHLLVVLVAAAVIVIVVVVVGIPIEFLKEFQIINLFLLFLDFILIFGELLCGGCHPIFHELFHLFSCEGDRHGLRFGR